MTEDRVRATATIAAPAAAIFAVLADPAQHAAVDGTGWVTSAVELAPLTGVGQVFEMAMFHPDHPDGSYRTFNRVHVLEAPTAIGWETGYHDAHGELRFGGWRWRYDLVAVGPSATQVTLTYDWSAVPPSIRSYLSFPPFPPDHLSNSLAHLAELVASS